jgi:hypothetical protein
MAQRQRSRRTPGTARRRAEEEDRGFVDRAQDEVRSWLGDEGAARRRHRDTMAGGHRPGGARGAEAPLGLSTGVPPRDRQRHTGGPGRRYRGEAPRGVDVPGGVARGSRDPNYGYRPAAGFEDDRDPEADPGWDARSPSGYAVGWRGRPESWGPYTGRGPKGYQRTDARILEDVCDRLADAADVDAGEIEVEVREGEVTMSGTVRDRWQKRRAEDVVEYVSGVREVHNHLRLARPDVP